MASLTKRDPSGTELVVSGAKSRAADISGDGGGKRSTSNAGKRASSGGGTTRARSSRQSALATNAVRHQLSQRCTVRRGTPVAA